MILYYKNLTFVLVYFVKNMIAPEELREILPSPLYNVKQLKLIVDYPLGGDEIIKLVDAMLWISPLLEILFIELEYPEIEIVDNISFKVLHILISYNNIETCSQYYYFFRVLLVV